MVAVTVRDQDRGGVHLIGRRRRQRVAGEEGVNEQPFLAYIQTDASVTVPGNFNGHCASFAREISRSIDREKKVVKGMTI